MTADEPAERAEVPPMWARRWVEEADEKAEAAEYDRRRIAARVAAAYAEGYEAGRAEVAAAVEALADEWDTAIEPDGSVSIAPVRAMAAELRAALAAAVDTLDAGQP